MTTWTRPQKYLAEFLGTFALLLLGGGSAVFTLGAGGTFDPLARVLVVSLAFGGAVAGAIYALGDISGGHFNPAVTISMAVSGRLPWAEVVPYLIAQVVGGIVGIAVVVGVAASYAPASAFAPTGFFSTAQAAGFGSQCYAASFAPVGCDFSLAGVALVEVALTFAFVFIIQRVTRDNNSSKNLAPWAIGLALLVGNLVAIPVDGASLNPARSLAPAILAAAYGSGHWAIQEVWIFVLAPLVGGVLAAIVELALRAREG